MDIRAIDHNVNIVAMQKNGKNYGMCCAWATQVDYDKILCALGSQSTTGNAIKAGDVIGFSNLKKEQVKIALQLGDVDKHSADTDKLVGLDYRIDEDAIIINGARAELKCKVLDVLHIKGIESENLVYMQILDAKENDGKSLLISDINF